MSVGHAGLSLSPYPWLVSQLLPCQSVLFWTVKRAIKLPKCIDESCLSAKRAFHLVRTRGLNKSVFWTIVRGLASIRIKHIMFLRCSGQLQRARNFGARARNFGARARNFGAKRVGNLEPNGSGLDSCKAPVNAKVSKTQCFAMFWTVVRGLVSIRVKNTVFLQWFGQW